MPWRAPSDFLADNPAVENAPELLEAGASEFSAPESELHGSRIRVAVASALELSFPPSSIAPATTKKQKQKRLLVSDIAVSYSRQARVVILYRVVALQPDY